MRMNICGVLFVLSAGCIFAQEVNAQVTPIQQQVDTWHSPKIRSEEWPKLGASDCSDYGSSFGYAECAIFSKKAADRKLKVKSATPANNVKAIVATNRVIIENVVKKVGNEPQKRNDTALVMQSQSAFVPEVSFSNCVTIMEQCFTSCKAAALKSPAACNQICSTTAMCRTAVNLTYNQFLDFQVELLAANPKTSYSALFKQDKDANQAAK